MEKAYACECVENHAALAVAPIVLEHTGCVSIPVFLNIKADNIDGVTLR